MTQQDFVIRNVTLWNADGIRPHQDVAVKGGQVTAITGHSTVASSGLPEINGANLALLPAGVDPQVHLRVPGQPEKETALSGLKAAVGGGVGALLTMPNTKPVIDDPESFALAQQQLADATASTGVKAYVAPAITKGQKGKECVDFAALVKLGAKAFTDDGVGVVADEVMAKAFAASAEFQVPLLQHAEFPGHGGVLAAGPIQEKLGIKPYPPTAESDMVARDLKLLKDYPGASYHVLHVSAEKTLELIATAKQAGLKASCEVSPHHLLFCSSDIDGDNPAFKMNPPLRSERDRAALRKGLADGTIDFVATDHAPHESAAKTANLKTSAFGTTGLEASLKVLNTLCHQGELTPERLVAVFAQKPAEFLQITDEFGSIVEGRPLRALLLDPDSAPEPFQLPELWRSQSTNSCFVGAPLQGKIHQVFLGQGWLEVDRVP